MITLLGQKSNCSLAPALEWRLTPGSWAAPRPLREPPAALWEAQPSGSSLRAAAPEIQPALLRSSAAPHADLLPCGLRATISLG